MRSTTIFFWSIQARAFCSSIAQWRDPRESTLDGAPSKFKDYITGLAARASAGETIAEEFLLPMPDGAVWHEHRYHPVRAPDRRVEAVAVASRNIHARKQAEGRLRLLSKIALLAETSELDSMLGQAAGLAVPELADRSVFELNSRWIDRTLDDRSS
jgi:hypothetical protein